MPGIVWPMPIPIPGVDEDIADAIEPIIAFITARSMDPNDSMSFVGVDDKNLGRRININYKDLRKPDRGPNCGTRDKHDRRHALVELSANLPFVTKRVTIGASEPLRFLKIHGLAASAFIQGCE
jgi:hypothetical protein